jgi:hypothetical protein
MNTCMSRLILLPSILLLVAGMTACEKDCPEPAALDDSDAIYYPPADSVGELRINQLQAIGSHNSYRRRTTQQVYDYVNSIAFLLPASLDPSDWDYDHLPLDEQVETYGMRSFELDIYYDPDGGRFANRQGNLLAGLPVESGIPELDQPGMKLLHIPDFDYNTHYPAFKQALSALKSWSDAHPRHVPIVILVETKFETVADAVSFIPGLTSALHFDAAACDAIDQEIKDVFGDGLEQVITPDELRGTATTLREAVSTTGWPRLKDARGKFLFVMEGDADGVYQEGRPNFEGRAMFVYADEEDDGAAFIKYNGPVSGFDNIKAAVQAGFMVRTRADSNPDYARNGDYTDMNASFNSGAQIISTDYYRPDPRHLTESDWTDYHVKFADGRTWRVNPLLLPDKAAWVIGE